MTLFLIIAAICTVLLGIGFECLIRWLSRESSKGLYALAWAIFQMIVIGGAILVIGGTLLVYVAGGTLAGLIFSIPIYLGMPGWVLLPYGAVLGLLAFLGWGLLQRSTQPSK